MLKATAAATSPNASNFIPTAPDLAVKSYVLLDGVNGQILTEKNAHDKVPPASLTKMMTLYVISSALKSGKISLDTPVTVSEKAWRTGGSRMFIKIGTKVPVNDLLQGIIVASGNDACVALAELIAGTEEAFADLMNQTAKSLGMKNSHFVDSTGLPNPQHYSTAYDMALLGRALIKDFPEYYPWYKQKWYTFNGIKQPNRNRLLWRDDSVDGLKTGHTEEAGFCLVASAKKSDTRLIAAVMGSKSEDSRANDTEALLNYGFHFFESHKLFSANTTVSQPRVYLGKDKSADIGLANDLVVILPTGKLKDIKATMVIDKELKAPLIKGNTYGTVKIMLGDKEIATQPLIALKDNPQGGLWSRLCDRLNITFHRWFG
ncbi:MAG: D-alanyl-D-alanine carboxypeptidase [Gammaproteobacteria bacterium]|nr:D-alanyl-D-alanine carboxypeptidase [Gammaproteobacteria bacterium]